MADVLHASTEDDILLVPCALGGTTSTEWLPVESSPPYLVGTLFSTAFDRISEAVRRPGATLAAILVYQGENNAGDGASAAAWQHDWEAILARVRTDLALPSLPAVVVKMPPTVPTPGALYPNWADVRAGQQALADADPYTILVQAPDGPFDATNVHLELGADSGATKTGVLGLGRKVATALLAGLDQP
jgi:hypothetical protein